jgi:hypothetical protein
LQSDSGAAVGDTVGEIHCAIDGIHYPTLRSTRISLDTFFSQDGNLRKSFAEDFLDLLLAASIEFQFDVVLSGGVDFLPAPSVGAKQFSGSLSCVDSAMESGGKVG